MGESSLNEEGPDPNFIITNARQETAFPTIWLYKPVPSSFCLTRAVNIWVIGLWSVPRYHASGLHRFDAH